MDKKQAIGIFDSGVGGLTVAKAITDLLPQESFIYFGDTRHAPYGDKSPQTIREYSQRISRFLVSQNCKAIVIACNSASAAAYEHLRDDFPHIPIVNVIDPAVDFIAHSDAQKVGIIATRATVRSKVYVTRIKALNENLSVVQKATPLLAALIEEGFTGTEVSRGVLAHYLSHSSLKKLSDLILGCTHYPLLEREIADYLGPEVRVLNSAKLAALALQKLLKEQDLLKEGNRDSSRRFFVSEKTPAFAKIAKMFFGEEIRLEEMFLRQ
jgi:glutamate racemase